ncbi:MAG: sigma-70 family RNA polymerase sigma factor [Opitutaceae bacterium]|nr:sigma-70 family RNA polymerase sigma factor [Cytophagales bacterium]
MVKYSDSEILEAVRKGNDKAAIKSLYDNVLPNIEYFVCGNSGTKDDAFDVFQDAFLIFYKQVVNGTFDAGKYNIHGFVYTISKNLWINISKKNIRSKKWEKDQDYYENDGSVLEKILSDERTNILEKLFQSLDKKCIEILTMSIYKKMSMKEIANVTGAPSEESVKVNCHRCRKKLSELVKSNAALLNVLQN